MFLFPCNPLGDIKKGPSTRIFTKLCTETEIENDWLENGGAKLKLFTWGRTKIYGNEMILEECTVEQIVTLFEYEAEEQKDVESTVELSSRYSEIRKTLMFSLGRSSNILNVIYTLTSQALINGVFAQFEEVKLKAAAQLRNIDGWKEKIVEWIREEKIDGQKMVQTSDKELANGIRKNLVPDMKSPAFKRLNGPSKKLLKICKSLPVHSVLQKAKAQGMNTLLKKMTSMEVCTCGLYVLIYDITTMTP